MMSTEKLSPIEMKARLIANVGTYGKCSKDSLLRQKYEHLLFNYKNLCVQQNVWSTLDVEYSNKLSGMRDSVLEEILSIMLSSNELRSI